ncbi:hypothetical protein EVAR_28363_1 [Eumeta japonica]|uniref:Uncharacterized protein n=1 Tax=Eumeta variegata TaxID=151549 RepID=A0A4C1V8R1_EUMVA|nr:hypothetical protein EVAR_28363_1 [Eumeta japonica]
MTPVGIVNIDTMIKLRNTEQRLEANRLRIAQSQLDITPEPQQSSSPRSVRAYAKRKLERRLNRQPKRTIQYERLRFRLLKIEKSVISPYKKSGNSFYVHVGGAAGES